MQLREMMRTRVFTIRPGEKVSAAKARMARRRIRHLVVMDREGIAGILSERDLSRPNGGAGLMSRAVRELMTPEVVSAAPETTLDEAARLMMTRPIGSLPVVEDGQLVGIVTATDILDALGREARARPEVAGSRRRAPFEAERPKPVKRLAGRVKAPPVPANIRVAGVDLSGEKKAEIRGRLGIRLGKFANAIERVSVRVEDVNGPRGGVDRLCRIKVVLRGLPSVVFESRSPFLEAATGAALLGVERAVRKALQRRRMKPLQPRRARVPAQAA